MGELFVAVDLPDLHEAVVAALALEGFQREQRPFTPHITLARCEPGVPSSIVDEFLSRQAAFRMPAVSVQGFRLYSSSLVADVPVYRREREFALAPA